MAISKTEICNRALLILGEGAVINTGQDTPNATACDIAYDPCLRIVLEQGDWRFATKRVSLGGFLVERPAFEFEYKYRLPNDFLRFQMLYTQQRRQTIDRQEFVIEGQDLLTNFEPDIYLVYTALVTDPRMFTELFADALAYRIALYVQSVVKESPSAQQYLEGKYDQILRKALFNDSSNTASIIGFPSSIVNRKF